MKFLPGLFKQRAPAVAEAPRPKPEPLSLEAAARLEQEREETEQDEARRRASVAEVEDSIRASGFYWPAESVGESRLSGKSWRARIVERLIGGWR